MASWLIILLTTAVVGTALIVLFDIRSSRETATLPKRMVDKPLDYVSEYFLGLLTGFCVGAIWETSTALLTVLVASLVAGSIFIVAEAIWQEGGVRYAPLFLRDLFVEGWPFVIFTYGIVFIMAWAYLGALAWLG